MCNYINICIWYTPSHLKNRVQIQTQAFCCSALRKPLWPLGIASESCQSCRLLCMRLWGHESKYSVRVRLWDQCKHVVFWHARNIVFEVQDANACNILSKGPDHVMYLSSRLNGCQIALRRGALAVPTKLSLPVQENCSLYTIDSRHFSACFNRNLVEKICQSQSHLIFLLFWQFGSNCTEPHLRTWKSGRSIFSFYKILLSSGFTMLYWYINVGFARFCSFPFQGEGRDSTSSSSCWRRCFETFDEFHLRCCMTLYACLTFPFLCWMVAGLLKLIKRKSRKQCTHFILTLCVYCSPKPLELAATWGAHSVASPILREIWVGLQCHRPEERAWMHRQWWEVLITKPKVFDLFCEWW